MRQGTILAAVVAAGVGGAALGDDHGGGGGPIVGLVNCSSYPWWCWGQCAELNACRSGNTPIGDSNCTAAEANLSSCAISSPPYMPPVIIVPPPACPGGQHLTDGGQCQADYECGDDEIGGGSQECEECGEGEVPNSGRTACQRCPHGEAPGGGRCSHACEVSAIEAAAVLDLNGIPRQPFERGAAYYCDGDTRGTTVWRKSSPRNACSIVIPMQYSVSCWIGPAPPPDRCDLASLHTHPYFEKADAGTICKRLRIDENLAIDYNNGGMDFSPADNAADYADGVDGMLGVSDRSCVRANRISSSGVGLAVISGSCSSVPLPHTSW